MVRFLQQPGVLSSILQEKKSDEDSVLESYRDGLYFQENFNSHTNDKFLPFLLYSDDFETANPLGSRKGIHKLTAVYASFLCLPSKYRANLRNIMLVALVPAQFVSKYGMDSILSPVVQELKEIERTGLQLNCPGEYVGSVKPRLFQVIGDNLALNTMLGYVSSFSSNYYCRVCKCIELLQESKGWRKYNFFEHKKTLPKI